MAKHVELLEKPAPKPRHDPVGYAAARMLEALLEALLALRFVEEGLVRNAAGKAFQAWKALTASILSLELNKVVEKLKDEEREWLLKRGLIRIPSSRLKALGQLVEDLGYHHYTAYTSVALDLHDYQYHGPDPDAEVSKYRTKDEAARDIIYLVERLAVITEERVKPRLEQLGAWDKIMGETLKFIKENLGKAMHNFKWRLTP